ncbi:MAG: hypothetical protein Q7U66_07545 [Methylobacter sp.]|nr:hypothetical protein [Methylobacter sp.]
MSSLNVEATGLLECGLRLQVQAKLALLLQWLICLSLMQYELSSILNDDIALIKHYEFMALQH